MKVRPGYVSLLNTIAIHERNSGNSLGAWARTTPDPELRACLALVAARETSHYHIFRRRIHELGFRVREEEEHGHPERLKMRASAVSDLKKVRWLKDHRPVMTVDYETAASRQDIDPLTRSLLTWFANEERDSVKLLSKAYARVEAG